MSLQQVNYTQIKGAQPNVMAFMTAAEQLAVQTNTWTTVTDVTAALQAAIAVSGNLYFPAGTYRVTSALNCSADKQYYFIGEPQHTIIQSTNAATDILAFSGLFNNHIEVRNISFVGGLNCISLTNTQVDKTSILDNLNFSSPANASIKITGSDSFINGKISNIECQGGTYGIYIAGNAAVNAAQFYSIYIASCSSHGMVIDGSGAGYIVDVAIFGLTVEAAGGSALVLDTASATATAFYVERNGRLLDVPDIQLKMTGSVFTKLTLYDPHFGPDGTAQTTSTKIKYYNDGVTLTVFNQQNAGNKIIDGDSKTSGSYMFLYGTAFYTVLNFPNVNKVTTEISVTDSITTKSSITAATTVSGTRLNTSAVAVGGVPAFSTGINVNAGSTGASAILLFSANTGVGNNTNAAMYLVRYGFDGDNYSTYYIGGSSDFITFSIVSSILYATCTVGGNSKVSVISTVTT